MLQATCQGSFLFAGKMRKPGEILSPEVLGIASMQVRDAMVNQKLIVLSEEGTEAGGASAASDALVTSLEDRVAGLEKAVVEMGGKLDELLAAVTAPAGAKKKA